MLLRRSLAIILGIWFLVAFTATLFVWRVQSTLLDADYVKSQLVEADLYNFLYDDALPALLEDALGRSDEILAGDLRDLRFAPAEDAPVLVGLIRDVIPREEFQVRVEQVIDELWPYATGRSDSIEFRPRLSEFVYSVPSALERRLPELSFGDRIVDVVLASRLEEALIGIDTGPLDISITPQRAREIAHKVAPGDWIEGQVVDAAREIAGWLTRDRESFEIRVHYADRVPDATQAIKEVLEDANVEGYLFDTVIPPQVSRAVGAITALSNQVLITDEEVIDAIELVAPRRWVRDQIDGVIDSLSAYVSGETEELSFTVDLRDRRLAAVAVLGDLATDKLREISDSTPSCRSNDETLAAVLQASRGTLPDCLAPQIDRSIFLRLAGALLREEVRIRIGDNIPDAVTFTRADLESAAGAAAVDQIDEVRRFIREGFPFTNLDLIARVDESGGDFDRSDLDLIRDVLSEGYTINEVDITERLEEAIEEETRIDDTRRNVGRFLGLSWLAFIIPAILLIAIAFLGGRSWPVRAAWAAGAVAVSALIIWLLITILFNAVGRPNLDDSIADAVLDVRPALQPVAEEALHRAVDLIDNWAAGFANLARNTFVIALVALGASILWQYGPGRRRQRDQYPGYTGGGTRPMPGLDPPYQPTGTGEQTVRPFAADIAPEPEAPPPDSPEENGKPTIVPGSQNNPVFERPGNDASRPRAQDAAGGPEATPVNPPRAAAPADGEETRIPDSKDGPESGGQPHDPGEPGRTVAP